jgi:hypothetical protein
MKARALLSAVLAAAVLAVAGGAGPPAVPILPTR